MHPVGVAQRECAAQVAFARFGVEALLRGGLAAAQHVLFIDRQLQLLAQPPGEHRGLVVTALAQAFGGQRHRQKAVRARLAFIETVLDEVTAQFGQQSAHWPFAVVFEAGNQAVDRKVIQPWRDHLSESG